MSVWLTIVFKHQLLTLRVCLQLASNDPIQARLQQWLCCTQFAASAKHLKTSNHRRQPVKEQRNERNMAEDTQKLCGNCNQLCMSSASDTQMYV